MNQPMRPSCKKRRITGATSALFRLDVVVSAEVPYLHKPTSSYVFRQLFATTVSCAGASFVMEGKYAEVQVLLLNILLI